jgi:hypothetical protein
MACAEVVAISVDIAWTCQQKHIFRIPATRVLLSTSDLGSGPVQAQITLWDIIRGFLSLALRKC